MTLRLKSRLGALLVVLFTTTLAMYFIAAHTAAVRIGSEAETSSSKLLTHVNADDDELRFLRRELLRADIAPGADQATVLSILKWTMNEVRVIGANDARNARELLAIARRGDGLLCGGMAFLYLQALRSYHIPSRLVFLQRDPMSPGDVHMTVEAWVDGAWQIYDPTFNIILRQAGKPIGAKEAHGWFVHGIGAPVEAEFQGKVHYPARIETYYLPYASLFRNVFLVARHPNSRQRLLPVIGPMFATEWIPLAHNEDEIYFLAFEIAYYLAFVIAPLALALMLASYVYRLVASRQRFAPESR